MIKKSEAFEKKIYKGWLKKKYFSVDFEKARKPYGLLIPPPNLTGELHLGHALQHSILDAVARFKRSQGFDVLLLPGVDHAGIQFEGTFDKYLQKKDLSKKKLGRDRWLEMAWEFKEDVYKSVSASWRLMGISADWSQEVFTLDPIVVKAVYFQFKKFYEEELIYKGPYIVLWCPKCNTAIEDVEVEYEERKEKLYFVRYIVAQHPSSGKSGQESITVATTRPETIFADVAVAVHPDDKRYERFQGVQSNVYPPLLPTTKPWSGNGVPLIRDKRVDKKFGTGALKITPGHDFLDYEIGKDNKLPIITVIGKDGRLTEVAGKYAGMKIVDARETVVTDLMKNGDLIEEKEYTHNVAVCERCRSVVEPLISEEWFVKMGHLAKLGKESIKRGEVEFLPVGFAKVISDWLDNIHDWCISRSLWWGHRIPVWQRGREMKVSDVSPGKGWVQDEQVLDTWFSSGLWPLITLGWPFAEKNSAQGKPLEVNLHGESLVASAPQGKPFVESDSTQGKPLNDKPGFDPNLQKFYPWDFEISAPEIKFLWIARMIMLGTYFTGKAPFKKMFFHGTLRDLQGRKFSKSLGNGIDPVYLIDKWGVDATRMALYTYSIPGRDGRVSKQILDERGKNFRNFATKLRNISRFIFDLAPADCNKELKFVNQADLMIKSKLELLITRTTFNLESLNLHLAVEDLYNFVWHEFADDYIEKAKMRRAEAQPVLENVLKNILILLHPFMPFITEDLYKKFANKKESIVLENWPS